MVTAAPLPGDDLIGTIIDDRYRVEARIGAGGMGTVYRSTYLPDNVTVALKLMPPSLLADDISVARFQREARVIGRLQHPNILRLHSFGKTGNQPYLAMQYVAGGDLSVLLRSGPLSLDEIEHLLGQVASALDYAHENQVIHRDIKPSNILLDEARNAIIADFGLARAEGMDEDRHLTRTGVWMGTPAYIAPELAGDGRLTPSVDLYALGCILYQMLTSELPFQADSTVGFIMQHLGADRPDVRTLRPDLPVGLTAMLRRAIARNVTDRYPTGAALVRAFSDARRSTADQSLITESPNVTVLMAETIRSPFKGLEAFEEADAFLFYGREAIVQQVIDQLGAPDAGFVAVIGASGSGKSSLVRAGVMPRLRRNGLPGSAEWPIMIFTPGAQPLRALANQLQFFTGIAPDALVSQIENDPEKLLVYTRLLCMRQPDRTRAHVLLIIDQFEEVFTRASEKHRASFLKAVLGAATDKEHNVLILPTMRADFYQHVTAYPDPRLATLFQNHQVIARTMTPTELRSAIESPPEAVGLRYESGLVETVLNDIADEPGSLPLLQYALQELYRKRSGFTMTRQVYELSGGVQGAVAQRAEVVYNELDKPGQALMRRILLRLVEINESGDITRRRVLRDQLVFDNTPDEAVETVLDQLTRPDVRLLTANRQWPTGHQEIDVSHEALIHRWDRLQDWVRQNRSSLLLGGNLLKAAHDWQRSSQDPAYLLRGVRLDEALHWVTMAESDVSPDQRQLITASVTAREQEEQEREKQRQYEIELERARAQNAERARNLLRWMLGGAVCFTALAVALAVLAFSQARAAQTAQLNAERKAAEVESLALAGSAANALDDHNADLALSLALEANKISNPPSQAQQALSRIVDGVATIRPLVGHTDWVSSVAYAPDGETAITASWDDTLRRWRISTGETLRRYEGHTDHVSAVVISPDGQTMLSGSWDGSLILWNVESGAILRRFTGHSSAVTSVALSPDGKLALSGSWDRTLILWNTETGTALRSLKGHTDRVNSVAFSPDGKLALSGSSDASLILWDMATGSIVRRFTGHTAAVMAVTISPDGKTALSGSADKRVILWNIETGEPIWRASEHTDSVTSVAFSADGKTALSGSTDRSVRLWNAENGSLLRRLDGHTAPVLSVAFSSDNNTVLSGAEDNTARLWDVEIRQFVGHKLSVSSVAITPDGKTAVSGSVDTTLIVWDVTTGKLLRRLTGHTDVVENIAISPDGKTVLSASDDKQLILWDITTGREIRRFTGHNDWIANVVFSPDGKTALSGSGNPEVDKSLILWDVSTGKEIRRFEGHTDAVTGLAFSPDGKMALSGSWDRSLILWDVSTGQAIRHFVGHKNKVWLVAISPDGKLGLSASEDGTARLWNLATGETLLVLSGHTDAVFGVTFSPDGKTALTASADKTVRLWDLTTGREIRRFEGHTDRVWQVVFAADGQTALSASADKTIRLWHISRSLDELMTWAYTHRYVRDITCEERDQYMIEPFCEATPAPVLTMPPSVTATPAAPQPVRLGETRGHIPVGGGQIWTYNGRAGEYVNIRVSADKPANEAGSREQQERDLFDARFIVRAPDGKVLIEADDVVTTTLRTTDPAVEYLHLPVDGAYQIEIRSFGDETGGAYTMVIESQETGPTPTPTGTP